GREREFRHAGREDWTVLLDANGCADARGRTKACDGNAADRTTRQCAHRGRVGTREPSGVRRGTGRGDAQAGDADSRGEPARDWDRQAGVLRADRSRYGQRVRPHEGSDEPERDGGGRAGRDRGVPGEAKSSVVRQVNRGTAAKLKLLVLVLLAL